MKSQALSRSELTQNLEAPEISALEVFQVESTGASISTNCSVSLLHRYCARLAHDRFPSYSPIRRGFGQLIQPESIVVQYFEGNVSANDLQV